MTLRDIRIEFIKRCGRYDLVTTDNEDEWGDNGANYYIQAGQRFLDRQGDWDTGRLGTFEGTLAEKQNEIELEGCWAVHSVYFRIKTWRHKLWHPIQAVHSPQALKCVCPREPRYYITPSLILPDIKGKTAQEIEKPASSLDYSVTQEATHGLRLHFTGLPPRDVSYRVIGHFHAPTLKVDEDKNYWSIYHPDILLKATMYELEIFYRNSEGAKDWLSALQQDLLDMQQSELLTSVMASPAEMGI